jgi:hypothetical protein
MSAATHDPWCRYLPELHRWLANPVTELAVPAPCEIRDLPTACAVWETLHYLLRTLLAWDNPGAGLAWWYAAGKPTHDSPLLKLVAEHWDQNNALDDYAAWTWGAFSLNSTDRSPEEFAAQTIYHNPAWWRALLERRRTQPNKFFSGGYNPLHLGHSDTWGCLEPDMDESQLLCDAPRRSAVLIVNGLATWRCDLIQAGQSLPSLGERSWHVEVFDRQHGYLGHYRQSRVTGRWFQGRHLIHQAGHALADTGVS